MLRALRSTLLICGSAVLLKVTGETVWGYRGYVPPDFSTDFLIGRQSTFFGWYAFAFYVHIAASPLALLAGTLLLSDRFRQRFPRWHRRIGRVHLPVVLVLVAPSGAAMALRAAAGPVATASFVLLAIATIAYGVIGWRKAMRRQFVAHRRWMIRLHALLCSAVVLRVIGGAGRVAGVTSEWFDPVASWVCWLLPLAVAEWIVHRARGHAPDRMDGDDRP